MNFTAKKKKRRIEKLRYDSNTDTELYDSGGAIQDESTGIMNNDEGEGSNLGAALGDAEYIEEMADDDVEDIDESGEVGVDSERMDVDDT